MFTVTPVSAPIVLAGLLLIVLLGPPFLERGRGRKLPVHPLPENSRAAASRRNQAGGHRFELLFEVEPRACAALAGGPRHATGGGVAPWGNARARP